jgi:hypothetical protein
MKDPLPSNRSFALVFVAFFLLLGAVTWWKGRMYFPVFFVASAMVGIIGIFRPAWLTPFNRLWMRFAELLHRVVNPVVLAILFFAVITPFALAMRIFRKDPLHRLYEPALKSYWIKRDPPVSDSSSMTNQF